MRRVVAVALVSAGACFYIASPFWAAWSLRDAVRRGDVAVIEHKVQWPTVRESLKRSLAAHAELMPQVETVGSEIRPSVWQRVKAVFGATVLDRFVETYVTPEGLPKLFRYRTLLQQHATGQTAPEDAGNVPWPQRFAAFYQRLKRAELQSLTRVELEVADRLDPDRRYVSVLELVGLTWKLTSLRVVSDSRRVARLP
ncbi:MAG: DUF2939 domain-containing protein [Hyphomicrobiaceae bacterium]|nr:DUF2939 domain-containing protein [Hyphomicrobiaceae bacterium]